MCVCMGLDLQVELVGMATPTAQATEWTLRRSVPLFSTVVSAVELAISSFAWIPLGAYKEILEGLQLQVLLSLSNVYFDGAIDLPNLINLLSKHFIFMPTLDSSSEH